MMSNVPKSTKLRFALITEDALNRLHPQSQLQSDTPTSSQKDADNIHAVIESTVNQVWEQKLKELNLDGIIQKKMEERERERERERDRERELEREQQQYVARAHGYSSNVNLTYNPQKLNKLRLHKLRREQAKPCYQNESPKRRPKPMKFKISRLSPAGQLHNITVVPKDEESTLLNNARKYFDDIEETRCKQRQLPSWLE